MRRAALILILVLGAAACQKKGATEVPFRGRVKGANGQPMARVIVRLHAPSDKAGAGRTVDCVTSDTGTFEGTARPGKYKVTLLAMPKGTAADPDPKASATPPGVPARFASVRDTPWEVEVEEGKDEWRLEVPVK